ncbi:MAG: hypothetical protein K2W95_30835 [Candidatus Obscuribacterales bacterium]|nr:hypothetical protein [Candidatus Obscuribacterales bacterium]
MENYDYDVLSVTDQDTSEGDCEQEETWSGLAEAAYQKVEKPTALVERADIGDRRDRIWEHEDKERKELLSKTARDLAKFVALDGTMSKEEKFALSMAFQQAHELGCEDGLIKAINKLLKDSGSKQQLILDTRQRDRTGEKLNHAPGFDRTILVVDGNNTVKDSHSFAVHSSTREYALDSILHPR